MRQEIIPFLFPPNVQAQVAAQGATPPVPVAELQVLAEDFLSASASPLPLTGL